MISIFKNNLLRLWARKYYMILTFILFAAAIFAAIFITTYFKPKPVVAVAAFSPSFSTASDKMDFQFTQEIPPQSDLFLNKYAAIVYPDSKESYHIETLKNDDFKKMVLAALINDGSYIPPADNIRHIGTNILGYLQMFLLLQLLLLMFPFTEDKEHEQITRIAASPLSFSNYLVGHCLFTFLLIWLPAFILLIVAKFVIGIDIGFTLLEHFFFLALICLFGTAFALTIGSFTSNTDTASLLGSPIILLTTILSGSFYSFSKGSKLFDLVLYALPQKNFITLAHGFEEGIPLINLLPNLLYILALTIGLFILSVIKNKNDYISRID